MHMADALISPAVGGAMWLAGAGLMAYSIKKIKQEADNRKAPLMGVLGAFIFAAQMINFTIPATGSSGHLGGGMILAIILGPYAALLTIASVLTIQALFFADGGLLALGCNIFNLGFLPCFIAYPLVYKTIVGNQPTRVRILTGAILAAVLGLQLGAFSVVIETLFSGITELPFKTFILLMQPIHLAIGLVEGFVTTGVILFIWKARPELLQPAKPAHAVSLRTIILTLLLLTGLTGGFLSWFASAHPDGLEWAMFHTSGKEEIASPEKGLHTGLAEIQEKTAVLPDYGFKKLPREADHEEGGAWPAADGGTSFSGIVGGTLTLALAGLIGLILRRRKPAC